MFDVRPGNVASLPFLPNVRTTKTSRLCALFDYLAGADFGSRCSAGVYHGVRLCRTVCGRDNVAVGMN
jgi:hypothetical protein